MSDRQTTALAHAFVTLKALYDHALTPAQQRMALRAAGACLWGMGVEEYKGIRAERPIGETIDLAPQAALMAPKESKSSPAD